MSRTIIIISLIVLLGGEVAAADKPNALFIAVDDPHEWTNRAPKTEHAAKLTEMRALAPKEMKEVPKN
jgi:hypothetical protein